MPSPQDFKIERRILIAAGTSKYELIPDWDLSEVPSEIQRIVGSFAALGYERQYAESSCELDSHQLLSLLRRARAGFCAGDHVVFYYTSHGQRDGTRLYLLTRDSVLKYLHDTALAAEDFAHALFTKCEASQVLLILDACYAGAGAAEIGSIVNDLLRAYAGGPTVYVIAAAGVKGPAAAGAFSRALAAALANDRGQGGGRTQAFLPPDVVIGAINRYLREEHPDQTAKLFSINVEGNCHLFPNPWFRSEVQPGLDLETQRALAEHWIPKARGAESSAGGWYFTGRHQAMRALREWVALERPDGRTRVITGGPGAGKSAVLAQLVTELQLDPDVKAVSSAQSSLVDGTRRSERYPCIAVHARRKLLTDVTANMASQLGVVTSDPNGLLEALSGRRSRLVVIIDALDESDESIEIVQRLLKPLSKLPQVFLAVGARPDSSGQGKRYAALGECTVEIDLDSPRYVGKDDVAQYVERRLLAAEEPQRQTPYRRQVDISRRVAAAVAVRANHNFLVAHTAVQTLLANSDVVDTTRPGWLEQLPTGIGEAFQAFLDGLDLRRPEGLSSKTTVAVLLPLAFAEGEGLPWVDLWASVATALANVTITDLDIDLVRQHAGGFVVEASDRGRSVYRLYHDRVAEYLRGSLPNAEEAQTKLVGAMRSTVPRSSGSSRPDWSRAHPYLLSHLASHALKARGLGRLAFDGLFVASADPPHLLQALSASQERMARAAHACYSLAFDRIHGERSNVRGSYLELTARQRADTRLLDAWHETDLPRMWTVPWARWFPVTPHRTIRTHSSSSNCVTIGTVGEKHTVIVSGESDGRLCLWNLSSGAARCEPIRAHDGWVSSIALTTVAGRQWLASGGSDGAVRLWDLDSAKAFTESLIEHRGWVCSVSLGTSGGCPVVVSGGDDATIQVWRLDRDQGTPTEHMSLQGHEAAVRAVAFVDTRFGQPMIVSGGDDATVRLWDFASGCPIGEPLRGHVGSVRAVAVGRLNGRIVVASAGDDGTLRIWDVASGEAVGGPLRGHDGAVRAVALRKRKKGRLVVVSGGDDATVRLWDLPSGKSYGRGPMIGHEGAVRSVSIHGGKGRPPSVVSGGNDATIRIWGHPFAAARGEPHHEGLNWLGTVALGALDSRPAIVSADDDSVLRVWDLASGRRHSEVVHGHRGWVSAIALGTLKRQAVIVSGGDDATIRAWDIASGKAICEPMVGHRGWVSSVAVGTLNGRPAIATGGDDSTVRIWDLASGIQRGQSLQGHTGSVSAVGFGTYEGRSVIVSGGDDGTIRIWHVDSGVPHVARMLDHQGPVTALSLGTLHGQAVVATGGHDGWIRLWKEGGAPMCSLQIASSVRAMAFHKQESLAIVANRGLLRLQLPNSTLSD